MPLLATGFHTEEDPLFSLPHIVVTADATAEDVLQTAHGEAKAFLLITLITSLGVCRTRRIYCVQDPDGGNRSWCSRTQLFERFSSRHGDGR